MKKSFLIIFLLFLVCIKVIASPQDLYSEAIDALNEYHYSVEKEVFNYDFWKNKYKNLNTYEDTIQAVDSVILSLEDNYTYFLPPQEKEEAVQSTNSEENCETYIFLEPTTRTKIPENIGYLYISSFMGKNISKEFKNKIDSMPHKDGYIIDLRYNSGGTVKYAAEIANMLLKNRNIFTMINNVGEKRVFDANEHLLTDKPVVILINQGSASSSEILAGALKDNKRALIIGEKSFGKGVIQKTINLQDDFKITITNAYYLTPSGNFIHKKGIEPDIAIKNTRLNNFFRKDRQLEKAIKTLLSKPH